MPQVGGRDVRRVELRLVDLKAGRHLQVTSYDETQAHTANFAVGRRGRGGGRRAARPSPSATGTSTPRPRPHQLRVTKKLEAIVHTDQRAAARRRRACPRPRQAAPARRGRPGAGRARASPTPRAGSSPPGRRSIARSRSSSGCSTPRSPRRSTRATCAADRRTSRCGSSTSGCGNAYLTFAAQRYLTHVRALPVRVTGRRREAAVGRPQHGGGRDPRDRGRLRRRHDRRRRSCPSRPTWCSRSHACDTATDDALARAVEWGAGLVLAAPCCHHDIASQLRTARHACAVRPADPARDPPRALRRHPDRRAARLDPAAGGLSRRRGRVRRERAHAAQHAAPRDPHRLDGQRSDDGSRRSTTTWSPRGP